MLALGGESQVDVYPIVSFLLFRWTMLCFCRKYDKLLCGILQLNL